MQKMNADIHRKRRIFDVYSFGKSIGNYQKLYQRKEAGCLNPHYHVDRLIRARFGHGSG